MMSVKARLAKEVLAEIPDQFLSYMKARGMLTSIVLEQELNKAGPGNF